MVEDKAWRPRRFRTPLGLVCVKISSARCCNFTSKSEEQAYPPNWACLRPQVLMLVRPWLWSLVWAFLVVLDSGLLGLALGLGSWLVGPFYHINLGLILGFILGIALCPSFASYFKSLIHTLSKLWPSSYLSMIHNLLRVHFQVHWDDKSFPCPLSFSYGYLGFLFQNS